MLGRLRVVEGDHIYDQMRQPMLRIVRDTSLGVHDTLYPACQQVRYPQLDAAGHHANCVDNFIPHYPILKKLTRSSPIPSMSL